MRGKSRVAGTDQGRRQTMTAGKPAIIGEVICPQNWTGITSRGCWND